MKTPSKYIDVSTTVLLASTKTTSQLCFWTIANKSTASRTEYNKYIYLAQYSIQLLSPLAPIWLPRLLLWIGIDTYPSKQFPNNIIESFRTSPATPFKHVKYEPWLDTNCYLERQKNMCGTQRYYGKEYTFPYLEKKTRIYLPSRFE